MKYKYFFSILIVFIVFPVINKACLAENIDGFYHISKGCTTAYYIDKDCDGYGVGKREDADYSRLNGAGRLGDMPDADDNDASINTPASVLEHYDADKDGKLNDNEFKLFFKEHKGYDANRVFYLAVDGNDANNCGYLTPCKTWTRIKNNNLIAGDVVIYRQGIYYNDINGGISLTYKSTMGNTVANPIFFMSYPGESVILDSTNIYIALRDAKGLEINGLIVDNTRNQRLGYGVDFGEASDCIFKENEITNFNYVSGMQDLNNVLIEDNIFHAMSEHGLYLGARDLPNDNITVRHNILYDNGISGGYGAFQHNGRVTNLIVEENIMHSNGNWGVSLKQGVNDSTFRNNLIFNNMGTCFILSMYNNSNPIYAPYGQNNNLFINNTCWLGKYDMTGKIPISNMPRGSRGVVINGEEPYEPNSRYPISNDIREDYNKFVNNIFVANEGEIFSFPKKKWIEGTWTDISTLTIENNLIFKMGTDPAIMSDGIDDYNLASLKTMGALIKNNQMAEPSFEDVSLNYYNTPGKFLFTLSPDSPAINFGIREQAPLFDLKEYSRDKIPDAGCYEYSGTQAPALQMVTSSLPDGEVNLSYSRSLSASGGTLPYTWSIESGNLPAGLSLNLDTGDISGIPTVTGTYSIIFQVSDAASQSLTKALSMIITEAQDHSAPQLSGGAPISQLASGTTQTNLSLSTNENSTCKYSTSANTAYASMANTFTTTGAVSHSTQVSNLKDGTSYNYYVRCTDSLSNINTSDYLISFSVASAVDKTAPLISQTNISNITSAGATITWQTNEAATSKAEYGLTSSYGKSTSLDNNLVTTHSVTLTGLENNTIYHYRVVSADQAQNESKSQDATLKTSAQAASGGNGSGGSSGSGGGNNGSSGGSSGGNSSGSSNGSGGGGSPNMNSGGTNGTSSQNKVLPQAPTLFKSSPSVAAINLSWQNPNDSNFSKVLIVRKEGSLPSSKDDGTIVYQGSGQNYTDKSLTNNKQYFYGIFAADKNNNYSKATTIAAKLAQNTQNTSTPQNGGVTLNIKSLYGQPKEIAEVISLSEAQKVHSRAQFVALENTGKALYLKVMTLNKKTLADNFKYSVAIFISEGTETTKILGAGERAGVISSYYQAFNKLPETENEWQDVIKIANGRWPNEKNETKEKETQKKIFLKVYRRVPEMANANDNAAVTIISYGLRPVARNMESEKAGIRIFKGIYGYNPTSARDWDIVRAIAYSGATR